MKIFLGFLLLFQVNQIFCKQNDYIIILNDNQKKQIGHFLGYRVIFEKKDNGLMINLSSDTSLSIRAMEFPFKYKFQISYRIFQDFFIFNKNDSIIEARCNIHNNELSGLSEYLFISIIKTQNGPKIYCKMNNIIKILFLKKNSTNLNNMKTYRVKNIKRLEVKD